MKNHKYTVGTMSKSNRQMVTTDAKWTTQSWQLTFWLGTERKGSRGHDHMVVESTITYSISAYHH
jgi:hypothetical protein